MANPLLTATGLSFHYPDGTIALDGINIEIGKGRKVAFLGESGAGKSTLFLHLNGILRPERGSLSFQGETLGYGKEALLRLRRKVGIVFQDPDTQLIAGDVYQEIAFGPLNLGLSEPEVRQRVESALEAIDIVHLKNKPTHFLSYGEKKRVAIASVIAMEPEVIICDEPTSFLDPKHTKETFRLLDCLNQKGKTVIISTHDVDAVYPWADHFVLMQKGRIVGEGTADEIFSDEGLLKSAGLRKPLLLDMYTEMLKRGMIETKEKPPKTMEGLF